MVRFLAFAFILLSTHIFGQTYVGSLNMSLLSAWSDPTTPTTGQGLKYSDVWGWAGNGREYAIIGSSTQINFVDVTIPTNPILVAYHVGGSNTSWREFRTFGNYLYAITEPGGGVYENLKVFNLATQLPVMPPATPISINPITNQSSNITKAHMLFVDAASQRLYLTGTDGPNSEVNGLTVLDLSVTPENPTFIRKDVLVGNYVHDVFVKDNKVYANHLGNGVHIYDYGVAVGQPIVELGSITAYIGTEFSHSGWLCDNGAYIMCDELHNTEVKSMDVSNPTNIMVKDTFYSNLSTPSLQSIAHNPYGVGNLVYISYYHDGILVYDVTNPSDIVKVGHYDTDGQTSYSGYAGAWGVYPFLPSGTILASDVNLGLKVIQLNSQCGPPSLMTLGTPGTSSISLDWNDRPATSNYKVRYRPTSGSTWTEVIVPASSSELTLTGLSSITSYIVQVSSQCPYGFSEYAKQYTFTTAAAFPIELTTFNAQTKVNGIQLAWNTKTETDFSHFELERSADGLTFEKIGQIAANGKNGNGANYAFLDEKPLQNTNYYRLKNLDFSDKFEYSNIVKANWNKGKLPSVKYISASANALRIQLEDAENQSITYSVIDVMGRLILEKTANVSDNLIVENLSGVEGQLLFVKVGFDDGREIVERVWVR
jgi:choice-of-anchor B domain-containing protein